MRPKIIMMTATLACLGLSACDTATTYSDPGHEIGAELTDPAILGGKTLGDDHGDPSFRTLVRLDIIKLGTRQLGKTTQSIQESEVCTGSLIARNIILTAAHCVTGLNSKADVSLNPYTAVFTPAPATNTIVRAVFAVAPDKSMKIEKILFHPKHIKKVKIIDNVYYYESKNDIALLKLEQDAPAAAGLATLFPGGINNPSNLEVRAYGFGLTSALKKSPDKKLRRVDLVGQLNLDKGLLSYDQSNGKGICFGDSGGPDILMNGRQPFIIGIHSSLTKIHLDHPDQSPSEVTGSDICKETSQSTYIPSQMEWIHRAAKELGARY